VFDASTCILCGRERGRKAKGRDTCKCLSVSYCRACKADDEYVFSLLVSNDSNLRVFWALECNNIEIRET